MWFKHYLILSLLPAASVAAQAPQDAALWDIPATTLPVPAALETGAAALFWNPAAVLGSRGLRVAAEAIQTSEVVGLDGALLGASKDLDSRVALGVVLGRVQIRDLVRTTTSPVAEPADIPVYEQTGGVALGIRLGPASLGALVRAHDARFDTERDWGLTTDVGIRFQPFHNLTVAAATRFHPVDFNGDTPARYSAGAQYRAVDGALWGAPASVTARYGLLVRSDGGTEHTLGAGLALANRLTVDVGYVHESAFESADWRLALALGIRAGRYNIMAARGSGIRGIGANYRVGLEVDFNK